MEERKKEVRESNRLDGAETLCSFAFYLVLLAAGPSDEDPLQRRDEVLAEGRAVGRPDLLPLGGAPRSQELAQAPRVAARAADLPARLLEPRRGHGRRLAARTNEVFDVENSVSLRLGRPDARTARPFKYRALLAVSFLLKQGERKGNRMAREEGNGNVTT